MAPSTAVHDPTKVRPLVTRKYWLTGQVNTLLKRLGTPRELVAEPLHVTYEFVHDEPVRLRDCATSFDRSTQNLSE